MAILLWNLFFRGTEASTRFSIVATGDARVRSLAAWAISALACRARVQTVYFRRANNVGALLCDRKVGPIDPAVRILIRARGMRWWLAMAALCSWPVVVWHTLQARRRLKAYALPASDGRLTLERVA